jgi:hypothetical protein
MDSRDRQCVEFAVQEWQTGCPAWTALRLLPAVDPSAYMHLLPPDMKAALSELELIRNPPPSVDDFLHIESSNYRAEFFEGLTVDQIEKKIRESQRERKQRSYDRLWALHEFFKRSANEDA